VEGGCSYEEVKRRFRLVETIVRRDVEDLQRMLSPEERLELWSRLQELSRWLMLECGGVFSEEVERSLEGKLRLAQLKIAAAFRREGSYPDIVARFRPEEYEMLETFEALKVIDGLSVEQLVEFIERREGKVYELVKEYYEKQYDALERSWAPLIGSLAYAIAELYAARRRKLEEAVVAYLRRRGLTGFILEIEEAIDKMGRAGRAVMEAERLLQEAAYGEPPQAGAAPSLRGLEEKIERLEEEIARLERELAESVRGRLREAVEAELEALKREREALEAAKAALELERSKLREKLEGAGKGRLVDMSGVEAAEVAMLEKVRFRLDGGFKLYDPLRQREVSGGRWVLERGEGEAGGFAVSLARLVRLGGLIFRRPVAAVEIATVYPPEVARGEASDRPAGLSVVAELVKERLHRDYYTVLIIVSPTGFTEAAKSFVEGGRLPPVASKLVTVYLVDPGEGKLYYNKADEAAARNAELAAPLLREEQVELVYRWIASGEARKEALKASPVRPFLLAKRVAARLGVPVDAVVEAFRRAEGEGRGRVVESDGDVALMLRG